MSSLGIFDKETKTYKKVADLSKAAAVDDALSKTSTNPVQNKVVTGNLTDLKYGEVAGGKNLFNGKYIKGPLSYGTDYTNRNLYDEFSSVNDITGIMYVTFGGYFRKGKYTLSYSNNAWFSFNRIAFAGTGCSGVSESIRKTYTWEQTQDGYTYFSIEADDSETGVTDVLFSITPDIQIEEGTQATDYEPYIPSVKMLAEENAQQSTEIMDIKMLGWTVPRECPIQNEVSGNSFIQKVGRVDLGSLDWNYVTNPNRFNANFNSVKFVDNVTPIVAYSTKYDIYPFNTGITKDKAICVWGDNSIAKYLVALDSSYTDATTFKNAMQGKYLYYELAKPITMTIDGNEVVTKLNDSLSVIGKCKNLLNPTLETVTQNGVTCTNNGDGTYILNGTATQNTTFNVYTREQDWEVGKTYRIVGCPSGGSRNSYFISPFYGYSLDLLTDYGNGCTFTVTDDVKSYTTIIIFIGQGNTLNNLVFKPMLTTNLSATYYDFVPYTGYGETLTHDVAELKAEIANSKTVVDSTMSDTSTNPVQNKIVKSYVDNGLNALKKSVSDGKTTVANAITAKGVTTATDATFDTMANNISQITTGVDTSDATATAAQILTGKTAYVNGSKVTGTMTNNGAKTASLNCGGSYAIPAGYHNGSGKVTAKSLYSQTNATATAAQILSGQTAWVNGTKITGKLGTKTTSFTRSTPTSLSTARNGLAGASVGNYALFAGGNTGSSYSSTVDAYDSSLTRSTPTGLFAARNGLVGVSTRNYALFAGGNTGSNNSSTVDAYNSSLTRSTPFSLTTARNGLASANVKDYTLFAGGYTGSSYSSKVDAYNSSLTRSTPTSLSTAKNGLAGASVGIYALFAGGYNDISYNSKVDAYNSSLTRSTPMSLSSNRRYLAGARAGDYALFAGGNTGSSSVSTVDAYNSSLTRITPTELSTARDDLASASVGGYALFAGGYTGSGRASTVDAYNSSLTRSTPTGLSDARNSLSGARVGDYALFAGGFNGSSRYSAVDAYEVPHISIPAQKIYL